MKRRFGFTLIEILIYIAILGILAALLFTWLLYIHRKANEATLRGNLHQLRDAIQQFEADLGDYPRTLDDLMTTEKGKGELAKPPGPNGVDYAIGVFKGPYLHTADSDLPIDPFTQNADWVYTPKTGKVQSASSLTAMDGHTKYSEW